MFGKGFKLCKYCCDSMCQHKPLKPLQLGVINVKKGRDKIWCLLDPLKIAIYAKLNCTLSLQLQNLYSCTFTTQWVRSNLKMQCNWVKAPNAYKAIHKEVVGR